MTKVTIDRELLERVVKADASNGASSVDLVDGWKAMKQIRAILAAPRQPEGDGLEVVGWHHSHAEVTTSDKARVVTWLPECVEPLCRLSDAQRTIAALERKVWEWKSAATAEAHRVDELKSERDTLRQQLAERDATIARLEVGIPRIQEQSHQMRQQRDRLAQVLESVEHEHEFLRRMENCKVHRGRGSFGIAVMSDTHALEWQALDKELQQLIDARRAALAEVKPCPESPAPTT